MTKKERHSFYKKLLKVVCKDSDTVFGFCHYINLLHKECDIYIENSFIHHFPELWSKRPKQKFGYWFNTNSKGWEKRIKLLEQCIQETKT